MLTRIPKQICTSVPEFNQGEPELDSIKYQEILFQFKIGVQILDVIDHSGNFYVYVLEPVR